MNEKLLTRSEVLHALGDGKEVEVRLKADEELNRWGPMLSNEFYLLEQQQFDAYHWRLAPTKKVVPLEQKDIPAVCWVREIIDPSLRWLIQGATGWCVYFNTAHSSYHELMTMGYEYTSTPQDESSWRKCEKEVEE